MIELFLCADGVMVQSIEHPGCVWDVKFLENGDLVTGCSDGVVRIWTALADRVADPVERESYFSLLSNYKLSRYYEPISTYLAVLGLCFNVFCDLN